MKLPTQVSGCACKGNCVNSRDCSCAKLNGTDFAYVNRDGGRSVDADCLNLFLNFLFILYPETPWYLIYINYLVVCLFFFPE